MKEYVFYRTPFCPFVEGNELIRKDSSYTVFVKNNSNPVFPIAIVSLEEGKKIQNKINKLESRYLRAENKDVEFEKRYLIFKIEQLISGLSKKGL